MPKVVKGYTTGKIMMDLWFCLVQDFRLTLGNNFFEHKVTLAKKGITEIRAANATTAFGCDPYLFKVVYQLESLFKRFCFSQDQFSDAERRDAARKKFLDIQLHVSKPFAKRLTTFKILQEARSITKRILGDYDRTEHERLCYFGSRSSVGVPFSVAYLDKRLERPLSGSREHIAWFIENLQRDRNLSASIKELQTGVIGCELCEVLNYVTVPKSYKTDRGMLPNTTIGGFYTNGLGMLIRERLLAEGLNLASLQVKHKELARVYSTTRKGVTLDLSSASDLFTPELVNMLLPRKWYNVCKFGRISYFTIGKKTHFMRSFMTMGLGHTFPLQTLLFYALLRAIQELTGTPGTISVYGDDLIYPRKMHKYVLALFDDLNFKVNRDKSFASMHFRESCGGDFYRGVDVRPFQPEGRDRLLRGNRLAEFCYSLANGLRARWSDEEVPTSLYFLKRLICSHCYKVLPVPYSYPDSSGWKTDTPFLNDFGFQVPLWSIKEQAWCFQYLAPSPNYRPVLSTQPYLWEALRLANEDEVVCRQLDIRVLTHPSFNKRKVAESYYSDPVETLAWKRAKVAKGSKPWLVKTSLGKRYPKLIAHVAEKDEVTLMYAQNSTPFWT